MAYENPPPANLSAPRCATSSPWIRAELLLPKETFVSKWMSRRQTGKVGLFLASVGVTGFRKKRPGGPFPT